MEAESGQDIYFKNNNSDSMFWLEEVVQKGYDMIKFWYILKKGRNDKFVDNFM